MNEVEVKVIDARYCNDYFIETDPNGYNLTKWRKSYKSYNSARKLVVFSKDYDTYSYYKTYDLETGTEWKA